jgi:hypothetical protein
MKKFLVFAALAAMVITSCNQNKVDYGVSDGPKAKIEKAANSTNAKKVVISGAAKDKLGYNQFEATDGGRFIIDKGTPVKADDDVDYITGTYVFADGVYTLTVNGKKFGTVKIDGNNIEFNLEGEDPVSGTIVVEDKLPSSDTVDGFAQTWTIEKIDVSIVTENKQNIGFMKTGCDLPVIAQEIINQAKALNIDVDIDLSQLEGMKVTYLSLTSSGTLIIEFENAKAIKAEVSNLDLSTGAFHYDIQADNGNEIINASADCKFEPKSATEAVLTLSIVIGDDLKGRVMFYLKKA